MKILVRDSSILTMNDKKPFISRGYIYIDQGRIIAIGEGEPQPELEFADYIVNDRFATLLPGFTVGLGNIIEYFFRFAEGFKKVKEVVEVLSRSDLNALTEVILTSLIANGATSVVTLLYDCDPKILSAIVSAASSSWVRTRMVLLDSSIDPGTIENDIRSALKSSKDPEAITRNIVSFGIYIRDETMIKKLSGIMNSIDVSIYIDSNVQQKFSEVFPNSEGRRHIIINPKDTYTKCIFSDAVQWKYSCGVSPYNSMLLNPRRLLQEVYHAIGDAERSIAIVSSLNSINHTISPGIVRENATADLIILDFSEPPYGPIPMMRKAIVNEIANTNFSVKTVIIGGEIVLDNGVFLTISRDSIRRVQNLVEDFMRVS